MGVRRRRPVHAASVLAVLAITIVLPTLCDASPSFRAASSQVVAPPPPESVRPLSAHTLHALNYFWFSTSARPTAVEIRQEPGPPTVPDVERLAFPARNAGVDWHAVVGRLEFRVRSTNTYDGVEETFERCAAYWNGAQRVTPDVCARAVWRGGCEAVSRLESEDGWAEQVGTCEGGVLREVAERVADAEATRVMERRVRDDGFDDVGETAQCSFDFEDDRLTSVVCVEGDAVTERWEFAYERTRWTAVGTLVDEGAETQQSITVEWEHDRPTELRWERSTGEIVRVSYVYE